MKNTIKKTIFFVSILLTTIHISALEEEKQESIITSDKMQKSLCIKVLGLMTAGIGLYMIKQGIAEPAYISMLLTPVDQNRLGDYKFDTNVGYLHHFSLKCGLLFYMIETVAGCLLIYKGYDLIANSDKITNNALIADALYKLGDMGRYVLNKLTFGHCCKS